MPKKQHPQLTPREFPERGGFSTPSSVIREDAHAFYKMLVEAARRAEGDRQRIESLTDGGIIPAPAALFEVPRYSRAVQVFAAMAIETALNTYGIMRFGSVQFEAYEKAGRPGPRKKLLDLLGHQFAKKPSVDDPVVFAVGRLTERRNALVHEISDESELDEEGRHKYISWVETPPLDQKTAAEALEDMETFFADMGVRDPGAAIVFFP